MTQPTSTEGAPAHSLPVFCSANFTVVEGTNAGDRLSFATELALDDVYVLRQAKNPKRLAFHAISETKLIIAEDSEVGSAGAILHLDSALTFMSSDGQASDAIV
jgi:hypothetical protein